MRIEISKTNCVQGSEGNIHHGECNFGSRHVIHVVGIHQRVRFFSSVEVKQIVILDEAHEVPDQADEVTEARQRHKILHHLQSLVQKHDLGDERVVL